MPASPAMRFSPGRERRGDNHKRGRSLENGIVYIERDDDLALFNEVQSKETDTFLLQSNDDFEDTFATKLRHFSDHKLGINVAAQGESSDFLNAEEDKNDYEWLITPPDTPLFASLDDETPQVNLLQRGRPRAQPISISRSSTMEKSHRSSRGSASPNRLSPSPRSCEPMFQPRGRASSVPSSSPPPTRRPASASRRPSSPSSKPSSSPPPNRRPASASRRPSSPSSKPSTPPRRASTPTSRRLSTGSVSTMSNGARVISVNSASPKVKAWQANIPGFSTEAPPNLRTSLADRPASYVRGSSPASRNGRHSMSPIASRSISSSHSHDRDRFSSHSKGSIASSADNDVESLHSVTVDGSEGSNFKKVSGFRNNKAPFSQKTIRAVSSSSAPKRSFDVALRQMDHRKGPQNMFRPLLSSVPASNFYAGKASPAWNSSVTTSSNASSDLGTSGPHDIEENDLNEDDATSEYVKFPDCNIDDEVFMLEKPEPLNEDEANFSPNEDGFENLAQLDIATAEVSDGFNGSYDFPEIQHTIDFPNSLSLPQLEECEPNQVNHQVIRQPEDDSNKDMLICSRCGCGYSVITQTEDSIKLCPKCQKSTSALTISDMVTSVVAVVSSQEESTMSDEDHELVNTMKPQMTLVKVESLEVTSESESQPEQHKDLVKDDESIHPEKSQQTMESQMTLVKVESPEVTSESALQSEQHKNLVEDGKSTRLEEIQHNIDFPNSLSLPQLEECEPKQVNHQVISQPSLSYSDEGSEQIQYTVDFSKSKVGSPKSKVDSFEGERISIVLNRSTSIKGPVIRSGNFSASSISYDDLSYVRASTNSMRSSIGRGSVSASSSVDFGPRFQRQLSSRKSDIENYKYDPMNVKYRRSVSAVSGTSSHAFHPSSVGTSTLDSFEASVVLVERDVADSPYVGPHENLSENDTSAENEGVANIETALDLGENLLPESSDNEGPGSLQKVEDLGTDTSSLITFTFEKVEDLGMDTSASTTCVFEKVEDLGKDTNDLTTCTYEEGTSLSICVENTDFAEELDAISEGELDHTCSSSSSASQCSESSRNEFQDPLGSTALGKDIAASAIDSDTSNHSTSIMEESMVLVEGQRGRGIKGRSLTLEEATDTILFCSSIVQNLAYEAATLAIDKENPPDLPYNNISFPLIPAVAKGYSGPKDVQAKKTSKRSSKSQKKRQKKIKEKEIDTMKDTNRLNIGEEPDLPKTRIVYSNNKENTKPPKLESKCNCIIM